jgi:hypothetical protein
VLATINAIAERLTDERGLVYRYDTRGVALGDARCRGGPGGVAPTVGSCDAGST